MRDRQSRFSQRREKRSTPFWAPHSYSGFLLSRFARASE
jgi:hypothetical protein